MDYGVAKGKGNKGEDSRQDDQTVYNNNNITYRY